MFGFIFSCIFFFLSGFTLGLAIERWRDDENDENESDNRYPKIYKNGVRIEIK